MYLIGDIGNTETKICLFQKDKFIFRKVQFETKKMSQKYLVNQLKILKGKKILNKNILFSSVVPKAYRIVKKVLKNDFNLKSVELKELNISKFIKIKVNKKQVGSDRIANAIGVSNGKNNYIVIDLGTATTFDVIVKNQYLGGVIAPGLDLSLKTLSSSASLIPVVKFNKIKKVVGKNTTTAVRSGFYWGYIGLINNILKLIKIETKKSFKIIITGGYSHFLYKMIKNKTAVKKDLTVLSLLKIVKN